MRRNLIFIRAGDSSLHNSWVAGRTRRNYDVFISYFGNQPGQFQEDGEYYEAAPGLKFPALARVMKKNPELFNSYDAIWVPDDDLMISARAINRMFDLFHKHRLRLAQPALGPGSYMAHPITAMMKNQSLHFSRFVEVMCPIFSRATLKAVAHTFTLNTTSWGIDFLWGHLLNYPRKRIAILDETPVIHTRPVGKGTFYDVIKGKSTDARVENLKIIRKYKINWESARARVFGSISASSWARANRPGAFLSLFTLQEMIDNACRIPIFYENRVGRLRLRSDERPDYKASNESHSSRILLTNANDSATKLRKLMGTRKRLEAIAKDIVRHWAVRQKTVKGKAMIVCMNRQTCLKLYRLLIRLRPEWKRDGRLAVASETMIRRDVGMIPESFSSDTAERFRTASDPLQILLVDSIHRKEFDCPLLNTLYADLAIPVDQHIQFIRRLMQIFKGRLGTLMVDYVGLSDVVSQQRLPDASAEKLAGAERRAIGMASSIASISRRSSISKQTTSMVVSENGIANMHPGRKIAHLFLLRDNLNHEGIWKKFFSGYEEYYNIYVHAKHPDRITSDLLKNRQISRRCNTEYGRVSLVKAELLLLRAALRNRENQFFLLHSESCVPIRTFEDIYKQIFNSGRSWLYSFKGDMWRYYGTNMVAIPHEFFFKSSQFFCLTRSHAEAVLAKGKLADWRRSDCPDEHYIPTVLAMAGQLRECLSRPLTFVDWNRKRRETPFGPTTFHRLSPEDLKALFRSEALFARKFAPDSDIARYISKLHSHQKAASKEHSSVARPSALEISGRRRVALLATQKPVQGNTPRP